MKRCLLLLIVALPFWLNAQQVGLGRLSQANELYLDGQWPKALELYRVESAEDAEAVLASAALMSEMGDVASAIKALESISGKNRFVTRELGWIYLRAGENKKAREAFQSCVEKASNDADAYFGLALVAFEEKQHASALDHLKKASESRPWNALYPFFTAVGYEELGNLPEAIAAYEKTLSQDAFFLDARAPLAALYEKQGRREDAWKQYSRLLGVDAENETARNNRERLMPKLTKKPEEILPPTRVASFTKVNPAPGGEKAPILKVGIGTDGRGRSLPKGEVLFRVSSDFSITEGRPKKVLAKGRKGETWTIRAEKKSGRAVVIDPGGRQAATFKKAVFIRAENAEKQTTILGAVGVAKGTIWERAAERELRGTVEVHLSAKEGLIIINHVNLEEYLYGVLASEMPSTWPAEALKAQAVMARSFALYVRDVLSIHNGQGYDLCDEQHCQVYRGVSAETSATRTMVNATRGRILEYDGRLVHAVYSSNCGGSTRSGPDAGWGNVAYWKQRPDTTNGKPEDLNPWRLKQWLKNMPDAYCRSSRTVDANKSRWTRVVSVEELERRVRRIKQIGNIKEIRVIKRAPTGRAKTIQVVGSTGDVLVNTENNIRRVLGLGALRSTFFVVEPIYRNGKPSRFVISGGGWGHGVGLCQCGAAGRAEQGIGYGNILTHYFEGCELKTMSYAVTE